jgi:hypothetical protein
MPEGLQKSSARTPPDLLLWLPFALFLAILGFQLLGPVPFGLANNNDFTRVLGQLRLWPAPAFRDDPRVFFRFFVNDYVVSDPRYDTGVPTSEWFVAALAKRIARITLPPGTFQLRLMGLLHAAILSLALFIILAALRKRPPWLRVAGALLLIFIWTDLEYVQQFNTAYPDAGAVGALSVVLAVSVFALLQAPTSPLATTFIVFGCFLLATKTQHETALPFLIGFALLAAFRVRPGTARKLWLAAPLFFLGTSAWMVVRTPEDYRMAPAFTLVFFKLAVLSPDPKSVLTDFGMPPDYMQYVGHYAFEPGLPTGDPVFRRRILHLVTPASVASFYWRHPDMLAKVLLFDYRGSAPDVNLHNALYGYLREADLTSGKHPRELRAWSAFRMRLFALAPNHLIYLFAAIFLLCACCALSPRLAARLPIWPAILLAAAVAVSSFVFASLMDAVETDRHLVLFQAATDFTIFLLPFTAALGFSSEPAQSLTDRRRLQFSR